MSESNKLYPLYVLMLIHNYDEGGNCLFVGPFEDAETACQWAEEREGCADHWQPVRVDLTHPRVVPVELADALLGFDENAAT